MNQKLLSTLVFGLVAIQTLVPAYDASEVNQPETQQADVKYAPKNATKAQVKAAAPTDLVQFNDPNLAAALDMSLSMMGEPITVADMEGLNVFSAYGKNISDLTGMEYAVNITFMDVIQNQITDLTPLAGLTKLQSLNISQNQVTDLSPVANLPELMMLSADFNQVSDLTAIAQNKSIRNLMLPNNNITDLSPIADMKGVEAMELTGNHIYDLSPIATLINEGTLMFASFNNQTVNLPDEIVYSNDDVVFEITNVDGTKIPVTLGTPTYGENNFENITVDEFVYNDNFRYDGRINQKVTYKTLRGSDADTANEGTAMTDEQLIAKFNVISAENKTITVDQSAVNYDTPGTYDVVFDNGIDTVTSKLTITNVAPTLTLATNKVTIKLGETVDNYVTTFGAVATEFVDGDLTNSIEVDDTGVDYNTAGTYTVTLKVTDNEGTVVTETGTVTIEDDTPVVPVDPSEEPNSEVSEETNSEVSEETNSEVSEETNSEVTEETNSEAAENTTDTTTDSKTSTTTKDSKTSTTTKDSKAESNKMSLASTGSLSTITLVLLSAIVVMTVSVKKSLIAKK